MTRRARSGTTRQHRKQPEDPTPWEEFVKQRKIKIKNESQEDLNTINSNPSECSSKNVTNTIDNDAIINFKNDKHIKKEKTSVTLNKEKESPLKNIKKFNKLEKDNAVNVKQNAQQKYKKKHLRNISSDDITVLKNTCIRTSGSKKIMDFEEKMDDEGVNSVESIHDNKLSSAPHDNFTLSSPAKTSLQTAKHEKIKFLDKLRQKRANKGIILLPPKVENRIYKMKKGLRHKGVPGEDIKEIIRKVRRKEEVKFRKTLKTCFKCREIGHKLSECPLLNSNNEEGTGICFKCGSTEHTSSKCSIKASEFPFATCFICKEQGHLSRSCPRNKNGVYPKGGSCNLCGNNDHLKKDCPTLRKKVKKEEELTVGIVSGLQNVEEIDDNKSIKFVPKKPKVVTF